MDAFNGRQLSFHGHVEELRNYVFKDGESIIAGIKICLYCCQRSEIENIFKNVRDALLIEKTESKKAILFNDMTKEGLDELRKVFIPAKTRSDTLFLSPIDQYDFIINTQRRFPKLGTLRRRPYDCKNERGYACDPFIMFSFTLAFIA